MPTPKDNQRRAYWLKTLHEWHWVSSAVCLLGMLLFGITGITLNNAGKIEARPSINTKKATVPQDFLRRAELTAPVAARKAPLPPVLQQWLEENWGLQTDNLVAEWSPDELYLSLPRPGGDAWLRISLPGGEAEYELTDRGWIAYLNDLHKGRHAGAAWSWFIDIFGAATLVFSITGLFILKLHAANRPFTWPMVGAGLLVPLLLALLFIH